MSVETILFYAFFMERYTNWNMMMRDEISGALYSKDDEQIKYFLNLVLTPRMTT